MPKATVVVFSIFSCVTVIKLDLKAMRILMTLLFVMDISAVAVLESSCAPDAGVRISGIGFEHCANTAIYMGGGMAVSVVNCYFEGDGMGPIKTKQKWGFPSSIAVDYNNRSILIEGCIFRGTSKNTGQIRLSQCINGRIKQ